MNKEKAMIERMAARLPRSKAQENRVFEADAEIVPFGQGKLVFNTDEFSEEDLFRDHDPYTLGWNLAVGGISDILAVGGKPLYYAHSLVIREDWDADYVEGFADGVGDVLRQGGVAFIGGDFGRSAVWRCTVSVIGELTGRPLLRSGAKAQDGIYLSGKVGLGNLEAFLKLSSEKKLLGPVLKPIRNRFRLRFQEAKLIRQYATACIDTSDGVYNGVSTLAEQSGTGFQLEQIPYILTGAISAQVFAMPKELLLFGECGEYELLFTVSRENEEEFQRKANNAGLEFHRIGEMTIPTVKVLKDGNRVRDLTKLEIRARDYTDVKEYLRQLINYLQQ